MKRDRYAELKNGVVICNECGREITGNFCLYCASKEIGFNSEDMKEFLGGRI